ncbi:hypothetical protein [Desulfobotulus alkaliphilus]|uniref:hypothetical protein n=1 Tax=Desulfobotulus alkaliphilus TaxID=622671 RepID=UPI00119FC85A|nr:hypothetical protein [Desulfobotulus alkaliphilus]
MVWMKGCQAAWQRKLQGQVFVCRSVWDHGVKSNPGGGFRRDCLRSAKETNVVTVQHSFPYHTCKTDAQAPGYLPVTQSGTQAKKLKPFTGVKMPMDLECRIRELLALSETIAMSLSNSLGALQQYEAAATTELAVRNKLC